MNNPTVALCLGLALLWPLSAGAQDGRHSDRPEPPPLERSQTKAAAFEKVFRERFAASMAQGLPAGFDLFATGLEHLYDTFSSPDVKLRMRLIRNRNPLRKADMVERAAMAGFARAGSDSGGDLGLTVSRPPSGRRIFLYSRELRALAACLDCHGTEKRLNPEARRLLKDRYPQDKAVGFGEGEVMGALFIRVGLKPARNLPPPVSNGR